MNHQKFISSHDASVHMENSILKENNQNLYCHKILENMGFVAYKTSGIFGYYNLKHFIPHVPKGNCEMGRHHFGKHIQN